MAEIVQMTNYGLWCVLAVGMFMGLWTLGRNYLVHIVRADDPLRGAVRALGASVPAVLLALVLASIPGMMVWGYDPGFGTQVLTYAIQHVLLGAVIVFALFVLAGTFHKGFRQEFGIRAAG